MEKHLIIATKYKNSPEVQEWHFDKFLFVLLFAFGWLPIAICSTKLTWVVIHFESMRTTKQTLRTIAESRL